MPATAAGSQTGSGLARKVCFTERTDKERKPIKMTVILFSSEPQKDPKWNPAESRSHTREGVARAAIP
jgi:hypothetical protein